MNSRGLQGLDMRQYLHKRATQAGDCTYDCFGFSCHMGTFSGGHYTAYARNPVSAADTNGALVATDPRQHKWYLFNDADVQRKDPEKADMRSGYLLFYRRRAEALQDPQDFLAKCRCALFESLSLYSEMRRGVERFRLAQHHFIPTNLSSSVLECQSCVKFQRTPICITYPSISLCTWPAWKP